MMSKNKPLQAVKPKIAFTVRSSAAEYLTFVDYAIHGQTAAEVVVDRANVCLISWNGAPQGKIHQYEPLQRTSSQSSSWHICNGLCQPWQKSKAMRRIPMGYGSREMRLGGFLTLWDQSVLQDAGKVSAELAH